MCSHPVFVYHSLPWPFSYVVHEELSGSSQCFKKHECCFACCWALGSHMGKSHRAASSNKMAVYFHHQHGNKLKFLGKIAKSALSYCNNCSWPWYHKRGQVAQFYTQLIPIRRVMLGCKNSAAHVLLLFLSCTCERPFGSNLSVNMSLILIVVIIG